MLREFLGKVLWRVYDFTDKSSQTLLRRLIIIHNRNEGHIKRKKHIKRNGRSVVDRNVMRSIKKYARQRFGKKSFWPYLALYSEMRGEFFEGWIPYDYYRFFLQPKINSRPATFLSDIKTFDYRLFGEFAVRPLFTFISGMFFNAEMEFNDKNQVRKFFSDYNDQIVIKEDLGSGGFQVRIIHSSNFVLEELDSKKNYVIQPYIQQHKIIEDLYPGSVNCFRVTTLLKQDGSVVVLFVSFKFGIDGLKVDNVASGGNYILFDKNGNPSKIGYDIWDLEIGTSHKNTGYRFENLKVPMYNEMLEKCRKAHLKFPYTRLVGWDVCIDKHGEPKLIEWNTNNPGFPSQEARLGPVWPADEEV